MHQEITSRWGKGMIFRPKGNPFTFSRLVSPKGTEQNLEGPGKGVGWLIYFDTYWNLKLENYLYCIKCHSTLSACQHLVYTCFQDCCLNGPVQS